MSVIPPDTPPGYTSPFDVKQGPLGSQAAYPISVNFGAIAATVIPYPTPQVSATDLLVWKWVVITNLSQFVLFIYDSTDTSRPVGIVAPFSSDVFAPQNAPQVGGMCVSAIQPGSLMATWYVNEPSGNYPSGSGGSGGGATSGPITLADLPRNFALGAGPFTFNLNPSADFASVAVQIIQTGGTATGFQVAYNIGAAVIYTTMYPSGAANIPWWIIPFIGGAGNPTITITPILTKNAGGTAQLTVNVTYLQGLVGTPVLAGTSTAHVGQFGGPALGIVSGATQTVLAEPATGYCWRVRNVMAYYGTAIAAIQTIVLSGTSSAAAVYELWEAQTPAGMLANMGERNYLLNNAISRLDQAEGLNVKNNASQTLTFWCTADLIPYPQASSVLSG